MACACKVNQQIDYLHKKYGDKQPQSKKTDIVSKIEVKLENGFIHVLLIPFIPFMAVYILWKTITKKPINIDKTFKLTK